MSWLARLRPGRRPPWVGPLGFGHCPQLSDIHAGAFAKPWSAEEFEAFLADPTIRMDGLFAGRDAAPLGFVVSRMAADEAEILSVALGRHARGRGHARILLEQHVQALAHAGIARLHLEVEEGNLPALALYRRAGFVQSGRRPDYYARPDGSRASALSMTLDIARLAASRAG